MRCRLIPILSFLLLFPIAATARRLEAPAPQESTGEWRHYVVVPEHTLTRAELSDLAAAGFEVQRPLTGGRYLVRMRAGSPVADGDTRIRSIEPLEASIKVQRSAFRAAAEGKPLARVRALFNDDVPFEAARNAFAEAGGTIEDPFALGFGPMRSLVGRVPAPSLVTFAGDERVFTVYGARTPRATNWNAAAAALSKVNEVQAPPYSLTGQGVALSYFELATADSAHVEFGGRLTVQFTCVPSDTQCSDSGNKTHATHTAGTMIASGVNAPAKGMAPKATLTEFRGDQGPWLTTKETGPRDIGSVADNNSFGYIWGWYDDGDTGWTWYDGDELIGGYDGWLSATFDHLALTNTTLFIHSAGNEAGISGPGTALARHNHADQDGHPTSDVYCYSTDGSGTDCPTTAGTGCTAGRKFCETERHPTHLPYGSVNYMASMKNIVSVGATDGFENITSFSSRGPARDGRVKPEIAARGASLFSTWPNGTYGRMSGTSMAAPVVTGTMALLVEQWRKTNGGSNPGPLTLKAIALATAKDLGNPGPDYTYGYGLLDARSAVDLIIANGAMNGNEGKRVRRDGAENGSQFDYPVTLTSSQDLRVFLTWMDPEIVPLGSMEVAGPTLVNDLDLKVIGPGGTTLPYILDKDHPTSSATRALNGIDNNEEVEVKGAAPGEYHIIVSGARVAVNSPQPFVVVSSSEIGAAAVCTDPTEPNNTPDTAYGNLPLNRATDARFCGAGDVDYFRFVSNATGTATLAITATDTPLRATLLLGSSTLATTDIPAGTTGTLSTSVSTSAPTPFLVRAEPAAGIGPSGAYAITASYPFAAPPRRRASRR